MYFPDCAALRICGTDHQHRIYSGGSDYLPDHVVVLHNRNRLFTYTHYVIT